MVNEARVLTLPDFAESEPFSNRTVLIIGGATGCGADLTKTLTNMEAYVLPTSRSMDNIVKNIQLHVNKDRFHPLLFDYTLPDQIDAAICEILQLERPITDIVFSAAGGMESYSQRWGSKLRDIIRKNEADRTQALADLREETAVWVEQAMPHAIAVNYKGPKYLLDKLIPHLKPGSSVYYYSSLWVQGEPPYFYVPVAHTKKMFEDLLRERAPNLFECGVNIGIISGNLLIDTDMGRLFKILFTRLYKSEDLPSENDFPRTADMTKAVIELMEMDRHAWPKSPMERWVLRPGVILTEISPDHPAFHQKPPV